MKLNDALKLTENLVMYGTTVQMIPKVDPSSDTLNVMVGIPGREALLPDDFDEIEKTKKMFNCTVRFMNNVVIYE